MFRPSAASDRIRNGMSIALKRYGLARKGTPKKANNTTAHTK